MNDEPIIAMNYHWSELAVKWVRRHRLTSVIAIASLFVIVLAISWAWHSFRTIRLALVQRTTASALMMNEPDSPWVDALQFATAAVEAEDVSTELCRQNLVRVQNWMRGAPEPVGYLDFRGWDNESLYDLPGQLDVSGRFLAVWKTQGSGGEWEVRNWATRKRVSFGFDGEPLEFSWSPESGQYAAFVEGEKSIIVGSLDDVATYTPFACQGVVRQCSFDRTGRILLAKHPCTS
ncbi:MAG TPA: hypothetical protein PLY87_25830 [Planctomycetaceae bacterium]|nr:hypothetical protein [Planctomycetaceae bacterium]